MGETEAQRRQETYQRSQDESAEGQRPESPDTPSCLLSCTARCPGLSPHCTVEPGGQGPHSLRCSWESHLSPPASSSTSALPAPCVLDPLRLCCLAWLSLSISFSTCNPEALTLGQGLHCHQVINLVTYFSLVLFRWTQNTAMPKRSSETHVLPCSLPPPLGTKGAGRRPGHARSHPSCGACRGSSGEASAGIAGQLLLVQGEHRLYQGPSSSRAG